MNLLLLINTAMHALSKHVKYGVLNKCFSQHLDMHGCFANEFECSFYNSMER